MFYRLLIALTLSAVASLAQAQNDNFPDRKALIINNSPHVELSNFGFKNNFVDRNTRFLQDMRWKNIGSQALSAFEIVILKYDAFDQRLIGTRWTVTGRDSANWTPLQPGEVAGDGTRGFGAEEVMTAIAYVRAVRLVDGTVWRANKVEIQQKLKQIAPGIREFGSVRPDAKPTAESR